MECLRPQIFHSDAKVVIFAVNVQAGKVLIKPSSSLFSLVWAAANLTLNVLSAGTSMEKANLLSDPEPTNLISLLCKEPCSREERVSQAAASYSLFQYH